VPYEAVVKELERDTVGFSASLGFKGRRFRCGQFPADVFVTIKVETGKYGRGVKLLYDVIHGLVISAERVAVVATKMVNDIARMKRKGERVSETLLKHITFTPGSPLNTSNMVTQHQFLKDQLKKLKDPATSENVLKNLRSVRDSLMLPGNHAVFMATDVDKLTTPLEPWEAFTQSSKSKTSPDNSVDGASVANCILQPSLSFLADRDSAAGKTLVVGVGGVESNFLVQSVPCVQSHDHPDYPAILVFIEYLTALEGPMWRQVRGQGLAYHYEMACLPSTGLLSLRLYRATQVVQAYHVARTIVSDHVDGSVGLEQGQLEAAISGVIFEEIEKAKTVADTADQSLLHHLLCVSPSFSKELLGKVSKVTIPDLQRVGKTFFQLLLEPTTTSTAVCCNPSKVKEVKGGLEKIGHTVTVVEDIDSIASV
jgi:Zn-dependent M16 (insulinase) family peptidase